MIEELRENIYELAFWVQKDIDALKIIHEDIKNELVKFNGEVLFVEKHQARNLAFPIKKELRGTFCAIKIRLPRDKVKEFENWLKLKAEILRFLITKPMTEKERIKKQPPKREKAAVRARATPSQVSVEADKTTIEEKIDQEQPIKEEIVPKTELTIEAIDEKLKEILKQ